MSGGYKSVNKKSKLSHIICGRMRSVVGFHSVRFKLQNYKFKTLLKPLVWNWTRENKRVRESLWVFDPRQFQNSGIIIKKNLREKSNSSGVFGLRWEEQFLI